MGKPENAVRPVPLVVKKESETRWSARVEAVKPFNKYLREILQVLEKMIDSENETTETRSDAKQLYHCMLSYDFLTLLEFWDIILIGIDRVQKKLKDQTMNFDDAPMDSKALISMVRGKVLISESVEEGLNLCQEWKVEVKRRRGRKKRMPSENARDAGLTAKEEMERVMKGILDHVNREMDERFQRLHDTDSKFGFLLYVHGLCCGTIYSSSPDEPKDNRRRGLGNVDIFVSMITRKQIQ
ncbi:hypothetical protein HOLleu_00398 [Holothuria leucospilota]|uniref:Uncharacterized protein n=1 Tax=Holothuria leucospilota TaxID=206669 RepID=A0A9Q1CMW4_HOLLE|nr:hypothetical protein HOLleu_00398 [Holothuria leucospilota]